MHDPASGEALLVEFRGLISIGIADQR